MNGATARRGLMGAAVILPIVGLAGGTMYLLGQFGVDVGGTAMRTTVGVALIVSGLALLAGIWVNRHSDRRGWSLIAAGAVPVAICFWWTGVVPAAALTVAFLGVRRGRSQARAPKAVLQ